MKEHNRSTRSRIVNGHLFAVYLDEFLLEWIRTDWHGDLLKALASESPLPLIVSRYESEAVPCGSVLGYRSCSRRLRRPTGGLRISLMITAS